MMSKFIKILLAILLSIGIANAQNSKTPPLVEVDTTVFAIGDQVHFRINLPIEEGKKAIFPDFKKKIGESLEIISKTIDTLKLQDNRQQITHDYLVTSFDTGYIYIPPFEVGVVENGYNSTITTDSAKLYVTYPIVDMKKGIFDIKPPANLPFQFSELFPYLKILGIILLIVLLIGAILWYFLIYKKKKQENTEPVDTRPIDVKTIEALEVLKQKQLWQKRKIKVYYSELTDILRNYLDERFAMHTMESTSSEILTSLSATPVNSEESNLLHYIFERADMAKFAKGQPLPNENDKSWNNAVLFVKSTKPQIIENEQKGGLK